MTDPEGADERVLLRWLRRLCRPNAPQGYRWTDEDVLDEKADGFFNGVILAICVYTVVLLVSGALVR